MYLLYSFHGFSALIIGKCLILLLSFYLLYRAGRGGVPAAIVMLLAVITARWSLGLRPVILTYLYLGIFLYILEAGYIRSRKLLWLIPLVQVLWVNSQGLFILGPIILACYAAGSFVGAKFNSEETRHEPGRLLILLAATAAASLINPYFLEGALFPFELFTRISGELPEFSNTISEFFPPFSQNAVQSYGFPWALTLFILFGSFSFLLNLKKLPSYMARLLIYIAFLYLAIKAQRNIGLFCLVSVPIIGQNLADLTREKGSARLKRAVTAALVVVTLFNLLLIAMAPGGGLYARLGASMRFGLGVEERYYPMRAVEFIASHDIKGNVYNHINFGEVFVWKLSPGKKVFIDGRLEVYDAETYRQSLLPFAQPDQWPEFVKRFGIGYTLLSTLEPWSRELVAKLANDPDWPLVYADGTALIFARSDMINSNVPVISGDLAPTPTLDSDDITSKHDSSILARIKGLFVSAPEPYDELALGEFYKSFGLYGRAENHLKAAARKGSKIPSIHLTIGVLCLNRGARSEAALWINNALKLDPDIPKARELLEQANR